MDVADQTLTFDRDLWVQYGGVEVAEQGPRIAVTGKDEDSYLKVFNHFGRLLKLYTFEGGRWVDADTGTTPQPLDESQAGRLPAQAAQGPRKTAPKPARKATGKAGAKAGGTAASKSAGKAAPKAGGKPANKSAGGKASSRSVRGKAT